MKILKIKSIKKINNHTKKYDITTPKNHNFFANNILVHNSNLYNDYYHARSLICDNHPSRSWMRNFHSQIKNDIPKGYRFCGENLFAKHSIEYKNLESYFYLFSIWNDKNECLSWNETIEWAELFEPKLTVVPVLYRGMWDEKIIKGLYKEYSDDGNMMEGYVVRLASRFSYNQFSSSAAKYVSDNFKISTNHHWKYEQIIKNELKKEK